MKNFINFNVFNFASLNRKFFLINDDKLKNYNKYIY